MIRRNIHALFWLLLLLSSLSSGVSAEETKSKEVIATVGGVPITRMQYESELRDRVKSELVNNANPSLRGAVLKDLIVELAVKQIVAQKEIDRTPDLGRRIDAAQRQILLKYYLGKTIAVPQPTAYDVDKFISAHPEFYRDRMMYHYADILVDAKSDAARKVVEDRLKQLGEIKDIDIATIERFVQWLSENRIDYGMARNWYSTEKLRGPLAKLIPDAARRGAHLIIDPSGGPIRVIALFGTYPDPVDPFLGRVAAADTIMEERKVEQIGPALEKLLAKANVVIYDNSFKDIQVPRARKGRYAESAPLRQTLPIIWNFALFLLAPAALYLFSRPDEQLDETFIPSNFFDRALNHVAFRAVSALALAVFVGSIMYEVLDAAHLALDLKDFLINGAIGLAAAAAVLAVCVFVKPLRDMLASFRWLPAALIVAAQLATVMLAGN